MPGENEFNMEAAVTEIGNALFEEEATPTPAPAPAPDAPPPLAPVSGTTPPASGPIPPAPAPEDPLLKPPKTWRAEEATGWETLTPAHRAAIHRREEDFFKGIEGYKANAGIGEGFQKAISAYEPVLKHFGIDPVAHVGQLFNAHFRLAMGSDADRIAYAKQLLGEYKIPLESLVEGNAPYVDPSVKVLQEKLQSVESTLNARQLAEQNERKAKISAEIAAFEADPKNPYVKEVWEDMLPLLRAGKSLKDSYEAAIYVNPTTRAKVLADIAKADAEAKRKADEEAAEKVRKANAANVKTTPKRESTTAPAGSIDETLESKLAEIRNRDKG